MTFETSPSTQRRAPRPSSVEGGTDLAVAVSRARKRRGLTMTGLARQVGISVGHMSRIERGERASLTRDLLGRLAASTGDPSLWTAARCVPPEAESALSEWPRAFGQPALARWAIPLVRQIHMGAIAGRLLAESGAETATRVELRPLAGLVRLRFVPATHRLDGAVTFVDANRVSIAYDAEQPTRARFLQAHAVGHAALASKSCVYPRTGPAEDEATDLACWMLAPPSLLEHVVRGAMARRDSWTAGGTDIVDAVARELGVPMWLAVRRLGEDRTLDGYAEDTIGLMRQGGTP